MDIVMNCFVTERHNIKPVLVDNCSLGAHANVVHFDTKLSKVKTYTWSHLLIRPFGESTPMQCTKCGSVYSWQKKT